MIARYHLPVDSTRSAEHDSAEQSSEHTADGVVVKREHCSLSHNRKDGSKQAQLLVVQVTKEIFLDDGMNDDEGEDVQRGERVCRAVAVSEEGIDDIHKSHHGAESDYDAD